MIKTDSKRIPPERKLPPYWNEDDTPLQDMKVFASGRTGAGSTTIYTCPTGKQARLIFYSIGAKHSGESFIYLKINGTALVSQVLSNNSAVGEQMLNSEQLFQREFSPIIREGESITHESSDAGNYKFSILILEEFKQ